MNIKIVFLHNTSPRHGAHAATHYLIKYYHVFGERNIDLKEKNIMSLFRMYQRLLK